MLYSRAALELEGEGGQRRDISPLRSSRGGGEREGGHTEAPRRVLSEATLGGSPITLPSHGSHWLALHARALPGATHLPSTTRADSNSNAHSSATLSKSSISAGAEAGTQFACFPSTKRQILTQQLSLKLTAALTQLTQLTQQQQQQRQKRALGLTGRLSCRLRWCQRTWRLRVCGRYLRQRCRRRCTNSSTSSLADTRRAAEGDARTDGLSRALVEP
jgi:hypothetical protein